MRSIPSQALRQSSKSQISAWKNSKRGSPKNSSILDFEPVARLSNTLTSSTFSCFNKAATRLEPIKPAPPVIRIRMKENEIKLFFYPLREAQDNNTHF